jgi:hypothetical protein
MSIWIVDSVDNFMNGEIVSCSRSGVLFKIIEKIVNLIPPTPLEKGEEYIVYITDESSFGDFIDV